MLTFLSIVLFSAISINAMFDGALNDLDRSINDVDQIPDIQNVPVNGFKEINSAFENSVPFDHIKGNIFDAGNAGFNGLDMEEELRSGSFKDGRTFVSYGPSVIASRQPVCLIPVEPSVIYQLHSNSYSYPKKDIYSELYNRPLVRAAILGLKPGQVLRYPIKPHARSLSTTDAFPISEITSIDGCKARKLSLRRFYAYGGQCWIINPAYQNINYVSCGPGCGSDVEGGSKSVCAGNYVKTYVWSYCEGLRYGARIQSVEVPLPKSCGCKTYQCQ